MQHAAARSSSPWSWRRLLSGEAAPARSSGLRRALREALDAQMRTKDGELFRERLARVPSNFGEGQVDPFGLDPEWALFAAYATSVLYRHYFRVEVHGIEHVPKGRALLIGNHAGQIPLDGAMVGAALFHEAEPPRLMRAMVEKWSQTLPFVSVLFPRVGQVVGTPENARRLLASDELLMVFPEGTRGISKTYDRRYQLQEFGSGFVRLALETKAPIVPVAIIGSEEQYISVRDVKPLAKLLRTPAFPVLPQLLLPFGFLPLPTRYRLHFGPPIHLHGDADDDDALIEQKARHVKETIQSALHRGLKQRRSVFF